MSERFSVGVDYGTNSVRALVVSVETGAEVGMAVAPYPSGEAGVLIDPREPHLARQNPADYLWGFERAVRLAVEQASGTPGFEPGRVVGLGVDTTGSTPIPVDAAGQALALDPHWRHNPAAHAWLWKDHTSHAEAQEITELARRRGEPYLAKCGGVYSSEWYWAKLLRFVRTAPEVAAACAGWVELADFVPGYVTGNASPDRCARSVCAAGHKAMYNAAWGGLPSEDFLSALDPQLVRFRYQTKAVPSNHPAGGLTPEVAGSVGLPTGLPVAVGAFDAHMGAVGAGAGAGTLVKILGTSTCDCMAAPMDRELPDIPGLCGIVPESILPGMYGLEAGQSAVGDIFNWFVGSFTPAAFGSGADAHQRLSEEAAKFAPGESGLLALDWNNGNRTVLVDPLLTGLLVGQTLHTTAPEVYRALIEATAFGALTIINRFEEYGVSVTEVVNCGGIAEKNPVVMQIYADVCNRPMKLSRSAQTCALGAAVFGAVVGGAYSTVFEAQRAMTGVKSTVYNPSAPHAAVYAELFELYSRLHDTFGLPLAGLPGKGASLHHVMKQLIHIRDRARQG